MATHWQTLSIEEAQQHPLYGIGGWLIVFSIGLALGLLKELGTINGEAHSAGMTLSEFFSVEHPAVSYTKFALGLQTLIVTIIYWLLFSKHSSFRKHASILLLISWPIAALIGLAYPFPGSGSTLIQSVIPWVLSCTVWVTYLQRSKRVRVTFENQVTVDAPTDSASVAKNQSTVLPEPPLRDVTQPNYEGALTQAYQASVLYETPPEEFWAVALTEFESDKRRPGLWARVFAEAKGNDAIAKAGYLSCRANELSLEHADQVAAAVRKEKAQAREAQLALLSEKDRAYELQPKGTCPNCDSIIELSSSSCPKCRAIFGEGSAWQLIPLESK